MTLLGPRRVLEPVLLLSVLCLACQEVVESGELSNKAQVRSNDDESRRMRDPLEAGDPLFRAFEGSPSQQDIWRNFTTDRHFRIATASDFQFPDSARERLGADYQRAIESPFVLGNFDEDDFVEPFGPYDDFAVIVVDTTRNGWDSFGIVILNAPTSATGVFEEHWVFRGQDLSSTRLSAWSGGLLVDKFREDGNSDQCYIIWHASSKVYSCDKKYKQGR